ncbi:MAG: hypothetical protein M1821_000722 [Bathelium mastoideum]|nr:MAG: hypothetical protein M1821_000722 [Bathelium mastoideum]
MMAKQLLLMNELLPKEALGLGGLVQSLKNPVMDAYGSKHLLPADAVLLTSVKSFQSRLFSTEAKSFRSRLTLEIHTAENATITYTEGKRLQYDADVTVPVSTIATGGADVLGLGSSLDSGGGGSHAASKGNQKTFVALGEKIYAIGYKKITWKSWGLKQREVDEAMLNKKIVWTILGQRRGREEVQEQISVDLTDNLGDEETKEIEEADKDDQDADEDEQDDIDDGEWLHDKCRVEVDGFLYLIPSEADKV